MQKRLSPLADVYRLDTWRMCPQEQNNPQAGLLQGTPPRPCQTGLYTLENPMSTSAMASRRPTEGG